MASATVSTASLQTAVHEARREHLLEAARGEFAARGLGGASMRDIARRAGCTTGAIYPLFPSKEALYAALLQDSLERLHATLQAAALPARTPDAALRRAAQAFVRFYEDRPFELNLGLHAFQGLRRSALGADFDRPLNDALARALDVIGRPLAATLGLDPARARRHVTLLFSQMMGALVLHAAGRLKGRGVGPRELVRLQLGLLRQAGVSVVDTQDRRRRHDDET
jgi:TetR/AcrR family transcriptional regulator